MFDAPLDLLVVGQLEQLLLNFHFGDLALRAQLVRLRLQLGALVLDGRVRLVVLLDFRLRAE